jgi:hypothetical protein
LDIAFCGELWYWRGPAPFHFVSVPEAESAELRALAPTVSYGWGMIPVRVRIGQRAFDTSLFPRNGRYVVPVKDAVRLAEGLVVGDVVALELAIRS